MTKEQDWNAESVGLEVEWYGSSCIQSGQHPADPRQQYPLMAYNGAGCGELGTDPLADTVDTDNEWTFYSYNFGNLDTVGNAAIENL